MSSRDPGAVHIVRRAVRGLTATRRRRDTARLAPAGPAMHRIARFAAALGCGALALTLALPAAAQTTQRNRAEIPAEFRWDFSAIYPSWDAWEAGMKDMDAKMDAFAAMKGTLAGRRGAAAQGLPGLRRDRQAPVPRLPLSAAAARRRHPRPGGLRPLPAGRRGVRQVRHRDRLVHARAAGHPRGHGHRLDRADAGARALPLHHPRQLPAEGARARRQGRAAALPRRPVQHRAEVDLLRSSPPPTSSSRRSSSPTARRWC